MRHHINIFSAIFKHIAEGRGANNTSAKSLKSSLFSKSSILTLFIFQIITSTTQAQIQQPTVQQFSTLQPINTNNNYQPTNNRPAQQNSTPTPHLNQQNQVEQIGEIESLSKEEKRMQQKALPKINFSFPSNANKKETKEYYQVYEELARMLEYQEQLDIKKAVFLVENAYFENKYKFEDFDKRIQSFAAFCLYKMNEERTNQKDNKVLNEIIFRLMSDTLSVINPKTKQKVTHYPIQYNFDDFYGQKEWSNMFVMKLVYNNFGQCHSMPLLYKILAKEIGAECFLSTSPNHLFIKYKSGNQWKNAELTNGHYTSDAYIIGSGYIKAEAIKGKTYLDTLSDTKTVALLMQDLAKGYYIKYGMDDFVLKCCNKGLQYYPNDAYGMAIKSDYYTMLMQYIIPQTGLQSMQDIMRIPQAKEVFLNMRGMYDEIDNAGVTEMPEEAYEKWLSSLDEAKRKQQYQAFEQYQKENPQNVIRLNNAKKK